jgi:hydrogenase expression/formation protein HypC
MCLAVPAKIIEINGAIARVDMEGNVREADVSLIENPALGDYVIIHAGFAISKYEPEEARRSLELIRELFNEPR